MIWIVQNLSFFMLHTVFKWIWNCVKYQSPGTYWIHFRCPLQVLNANEIWLLSNLNICLCKLLEHSTLLVIWIDRFYLAITFLRGISSITQSLIKKKKCKNVDTDSTGKYWNFSLTHLSYIYEILHYCLSMTADT